MSQQLIRRAFETPLKAWADVQTPSPVPIAWENVPFTAPLQGGAKARYIAASVLPADSATPDLAGAMREYRGIYQVLIFTPPGTGPGTADALIDSLVAAFPPAEPLVADTLTVYLTAPFSAAPAMDDPDGYLVPVSAPYRAFA